MKQTKFESWLEVFFNYASGFIIAYFVYARIILPYPYINDSPFLVTSIFTLVSVCRSYLWRRFFNKGLHKVFMRLDKPFKRVHYQYTIYSERLARFRGL